MVSGSISANASIPAASKDLGKKKRANRTAKLKQCKLDARREQWLSQGVVKNEERKEDSLGQRGMLPCKKGRKNVLGDPETRRRGAGDDENSDGLIPREFELYSASDSPTGSAILYGSGSDSGTNFSASSSSGSSTSSAGCYSGSITEEEEEEEDGQEDDCLDDWEAMADALEATDNSKRDKSCVDSGADCDSKSVVDSSLTNSGSTREVPRKECSNNLRPRLASGNNRAWRPDDALRPETLPNLAKQWSFPTMARHYGEGLLPWSHANACVPSSCPICYEDLDLTDTSFLPCSCGFRLCLFCHKRILEDDGRCPGCRKPYERDVVKTEATLQGGSLTLRLARSCSLVERT